MMPRLTFLLISLWLGDAAAQNAPAAPAAASQTAIPAARPSPNAAPAASAKAATAAAPAATPAPAPAPAAAKAEAPKAEPAPAPAEPPPKPKPAKKGKDTEPPPPPKPQGPLKAPSCAVADFRAIAMDNTDEQVRRAKASAWLKKVGPTCSAEQLIVIRNNRSQWLGNADSATLATLVDGLLESFAETNRDVSILLYGTPPSPPKSKNDDAARNSAASKKK